MNTPAPNTNQTLTVGHLTSILDTPNWITDVQVFVDLTDRSVWVSSSKSAVRDSLWNIGSSTKVPARVAGETLFFGGTK